jgi:S-adenosylmethionine decarboxylase
MNSTPLRTRLAFVASSEAVIDIFDTYCYQKIASVPIRDIIGDNLAAGSMPAGSLGVESRGYYGKPLQSAGRTRMTGTEWLVDVEGCPAVALCDLPRLRSLCARIINELSLNVVGQPLWHQFPEPGGVTGIYLLSESHLTCHTFPEYGTATFNLFCCRPRPDWNWHEQLAEAIGAERVHVRRMERGVTEGLTAVLADIGDAQ